MKKELSNNINFKKILPCIILLLWICVIWGHSKMPADISSNESSSILLFINKMIAFTGISLSEFFIRKAGHFTEYMILGVLLYTNYRLICQKCSIARTFINSLFTGVIIALIDESIQAFTPGRSCEVRDVWIDFAGVCVGVLIIGYLILKKFVKND